MKRLVIFGTSNFADAARYYFEHDSDYQIVAYCVDAAFRQCDEYAGRPVVDFEEVVEKYGPEDHDLFVAAGIRDVNRQRQAKVAEAEAKGYRLATYVSSRATVPEGVEFGPNTWIMEHAHLHPLVQIGRDSIIWSHSTIGLKSVIGEHCWISGGLVGESVTIGRNTFIGLGATVASFVRVGVQNIIGAGALILRDTGDDQIYRGHASTPSSAPSTRFRNFNG